MTKQQSKVKKLFGIFILLILVVIVLPFAIVTFVYFIEIKPHVDTEINTFVESIKNIKEPQSRIREIANFTEKGYYQTYNVKSNPLSSLSSIWGFQVFDDPQKFRVQSRIIFANDPYFIAYFKTGACGESAALFNFIANKSGFESRIVGTRAEDHVWDEVKINNSWVQVDPTIYYYYYNDPVKYPGYADFWYDNPQAYSKIGWIDGGYSTVFVMDTNEDLSTKYCNTSQLSILCQNCDNIKIKPDNGRGFSIDQEMHNSEATFHLGNRNYTIFADKTFIPFLLVREKNTTISLIDDKNVNISSIQEEIRPTIYSQILFILGFIALFLLTLLFITGMVIENYKKWQGRRNEGDISDSKEIENCDIENQEEERL